MPDVRSRRLGEEPPVLEDLVEQLGGLALAAQLERHGRDRRLEAPRSASGTPTTDSGRARARSLRSRGSVARSLSSRRAWFSCDVQAGQRVQPPAVVAGLDDLRVEPQAAARRRRRTSSISSTSKPSSLSRRSRSSMR